MADLQAAVATQVKNIEAKSGQSLAALQAAAAASGLARHGEKRSWLMETFGLGYGDANAVLVLASQAETALAVDDPLDAIYTGPKAALRPLHAHITALVDAFGAHEKAPKKTYVSLRRKKQFAMVGPATKDQIEIGLNHKDLPAHPRLKVLPAGGMCNYSVRVASAAEVDADVQRWLRAAYDAAG